VLSLIEEEDLKYEPLNVQKRYNKPRRKSKQKWSTLGEPSGKWDYYVREVERILANEVAYPAESSINVYKPPEDSMMGPPVYPPSTGNYQQYDGSQLQPKSQKGFKGDYGNYHNQQWSLPPAYAGTGALLVLPEDPGLWDDTISRWETITINVLNSQSWSDNRSKLLYVENLLGEQEKLMWQQWRTTYPEIYETLIGMADDPQNITSHMRTIIMMEDPYRGSTRKTGYCSKRS
ncbi:hypothetical protein Tco_0607045, partial [Tanacetum coccineum]